MNSLSDVWKILLERLKQDLSQTTINAWFDEVKVVTMEDSALVLHCSSPFKKEIIEKRFTPQIKDALRDIFSADLEVKILDDEQLEVYHGVRPDHPDVPGENDAFTFETFVVGPQTKMAYAAARSVSEKPAGKFNPLFIYGDSGLGKTHLLHAIARQTKRLALGLYFAVRIQTKGEVSPYTLYLVTVTNRFIHTPQGFVGFYCGCGKYYQ